MKVRGQGQKANSSSARGLLNCKKNELKEVESWAEEPEQICELKQEEVQGKSALVQFNCLPSTAQAFLLCFALLCFA